MTQYDNSYAIGGFVYVIKNVNEQHDYKIGETHNPEKRIKQLQRKWPHLQMEITHLITCTNRSLCEYFIQWSLREFLIEREWFKLPPDVLARLMTIKTDFDVYNMLWAGTSVTGVTIIGTTALISAATTKGGAE